MAISRRHRLSALAASCLTLAACSSGSTTKTTVVQKLPHTVMANGAVSGSSIALTKKANAQAVITPNGSTQVLIGQLAPSGLDGSTLVQAPHGSSVLPLSWSFSPSTGTVNAGSHKASLVVTAGGKSWQVTPDVSSGGRALITVPTTSLNGVSVAVVFDGLPQYVSTSSDSPLIAADSPAAVYYDGHSLTGRGSCPPVTSGSSNAPGLFFNATCGFTTTTRSPWLPGRGWASPKHQWVSVGAIFVPGTMSFKDSAGQVAHYANTSATLPYALSGSTGAVSLTTKNAEKDIIFMTPQSSNVSVTLHQQYLAKASGTMPSDAPVQQTVTLDSTSTLVFDSLSPSAQNS